MNKKILIIITIVFWSIVLAFVFFFIFKNLTHSFGFSNKTNKQSASALDKLQYFPVNYEDMLIPPKMYGLWPYGIKGNNSQSHDEGHPGWDFELKKGAKVYAVSDLEIEQIHDGDMQKGKNKIQVIEAYANLSSGKYHIVYHSVANLEPNIKEGSIIQAGQPLAEAGYPLSDNSTMIHFGVFPPKDSVGACPTPYFSESAKKVLNKILAISIDIKTGKPYTLSCVGKINKELYYKNYPDRVKYLEGGEQWE